MVVFIVVVFSLGICLPPISVAIVWNVLLGIFLKRNRERLQSNTSSNSTPSNKERGSNNIDRATVIIAVTIAVHVVFLLLFGGGSLLVLLLFRKAASSCVRGNTCYRLITSLLGVAYFVLFSVEAVVYLYKFAIARKGASPRLGTRKKSSPPLFLLKKVPAPLFS